MIWVALGHFYMYGVAYAANTQMPIIIRNRGDCDKVKAVPKAITKLFSKLEYLFWKEND